METLAPPLLSKSVFPGSYFLTFVPGRARRLGRARTGAVANASPGGRPRRNALREKLAREAQVSVRDLVFRKNGNLVEDVGDNGFNFRKNGSLGALVGGNGCNVDKNGSLVEIMGDHGFNFSKNGSLGEKMWEDGSNFCKNGSLEEDLEESGSNFSRNGSFGEDVGEIVGNGGDGVDVVVGDEEEMGERIQDVHRVSEVDEKGGGELGARLSSVVVGAKGVAEEMRKRGRDFIVNSSIGNPVKLKVGGFGRVGAVILCGWFVLWVVKKLGLGGREEQELTWDQKEMLRMKMKMWMEKERENSKVEVLREETDLPVKKPFARPQFDRSELMDAISRAKERSDYSTASSSVSSNTSTRDMQLRRVEKIQNMARKVREDEKMASLMHESEKEQDGVLSQYLPFSKGASERRKTVRGTFENLSQDFSLEREVESNAADVEPLEDNGHHQIKDLDGSHASGANLEIDDGYALVQSGTEEVNFRTEDVNGYDNVPSSLETEDKNLSRSTFLDGNQFHASSVEVSSTNVEASNVSKPRVITSVKEAREYLSQKYETVTGEEKLNNQTDSKETKRSISEPNGSKIPQLHHNLDHVADAGSSIVEEGPGSSKKISTEKSSLPEELQDVNVNGLESNNPTSKFLPSSELMSEAVDPNVPGGSKLSWVEKNFENFEPIVRKIGLGFKENYMVAKEEKSEVGSCLSYDLGDLVTGMNDELEWMKDDNLSSIVFKVRENELAGRDPFYNMAADDKRSFFEGLEKKVEKENEKLEILHKWVHSRVENLDYGSEGISLYDPPEKIIPRWKGEDPETIGNIVKRKSPNPSENASNAASSGQGLKLQQTASGLSSVDRSYKGNLQDTESMSVKTVIQSSDGSARVGRKEGKEHWEHTKKWSQEFLQVYNDETDPEVRSIMKDMGTDLDRWITQKEVTEAADIMTRLPKRKRQYIEKKMNKLKEEIELYGQQAVVSKYREYSDEKEEDYLWWLDLPFILCIELYTSEDGVQKSGFYSLEMAQDLELDPKPCHVVAFENPTDAKNFCYIMQAHLEMLGSGTAFVVARPPKDAFREAKANGHGITVIRKGQLRLNIDQTLEEVESEVEEIGSKIYHDQITREHSVDVGTLMEGLVRSEKMNKKDKPRRSIRS